MKTEEFNSVAGSGQKFLSLSNFPDLHWCPTRCPAGAVLCDVQLASNLIIMQWLRTNGALPPLPRTASSCILEEYVFSQG